MDKAVDRINELRGQLTAMQVELANDRERLATLEVKADRDAMRIDRIVSYLTPQHRGRDD